MATVTSNHAMTWRWSNCLELSASGMNVPLARLCLLAAMPSCSHYFPFYFLHWLTTDKCSFNQSIDAQDKGEELGRGKPLKFLWMTRPNTAVVRLYVMKRSALSAAGTYIEARPRRTTFSRAPVILSVKFEWTNNQYQCHYTGGIAIRLTSLLVCSGGIVFSESLPMVVSKRKARKKFFFLVSQARPHAFGWGLLLINYSNWRNNSPHPPLTVQCTGCQYSSSQVFCLTVHFFDPFSLCYEFSTSID